MMKPIAVIIGSLAALQLMAGPACCAVKSQSTDAADGKPAISIASTAETMTEEQAKECEGKECTLKKCDPADMQQCEANMKKLGAAWQAMQGEKLGKVDTNALKQILAQSKNIVVLDARTSKYDDGKRIPSAKIVGPSPSAEEIAKLIPSKESYVVTYCGGIQCPLGGKLAAKLKGMGYTHVVEYPEGIAGWIASGNEVTVAANN